MENNYYKTTILMDKKLNNWYALLYKRKDEFNLNFKLDTRINHTSDLVNIGLSLGFKAIMAKLLAIKPKGSITLDDIESIRITDIEDALIL